MPREEMIDFIVSMVNELEDLTDKDNYELICKLNNMTKEELEKEFDFYDELSLK